jgi:TRAP-type C4-dicarboxylate transport system permease small subunit
MKIDFILQRIEQVFLWIGGAVLMFAMLLTSADALLRYLFNSPIPGAYEILQEYLIPYLVYLTIAFVFAKGGHVRVTLFTDRLPERLNQIIMMIFNGLAAALFLLIAYGSLKRTISATHLGEFSSSILSYPLAPAYFSVVIGSLFLSIRLIQAIITKKHPNHSIMDE